MSSILKALQKLENDRKKCTNDQLRIDAKILQNGSPTRFFRPALFLIAVALFVCGGSATYFYMKHDATDVLTLSSSRSESSSLQPPASVVIPPMLQNNTVQTHPSTLMTAKTSTVIGTQSRSNNGPTKLSQPPTPSKQVETTPIISVPIPVSLQQQSPSTNAVSRPVLTINGIAFQEGGSDNLAVINGITVSNGAVIEGIKVEDIQKDRVRFSHGGEKFEIILNKSNR